MRPLSDSDRTQRGLRLLDAERSGGGGSRKLYNPNHVPGGSRQGGQFAPKGGGGGGGISETGNGGAGRGVFGRLRGLFGGGAHHGGGGGGGGSGGGKGKDEAQGSRALVPAGAGHGRSVEEEGGPSGKEAKAWAKEMGRETRGDARYTQEGIKTAASQPMDHEAIRRQAERLGVGAHEMELEARMNMASIASVPHEQMSAQLRDHFFRSAARGEETYAYPPISSSPRTAQWNVWYRGQRARITELESYVRQSQHQPHGAPPDLMLPPGGGGSGLSERARIAAGLRLMAANRKRTTGQRRQVEQGMALFTRQSR